MKKIIGYICVNFIRKEATKKCILSLKEHCPFIKVYVADQDAPTDEMIAFYKENNVNYYFVEYDLGLSNARNFLVKKIKEPYLMWGDNDFIFTEKNNILKAMKILNKDKKLGFVGGSIILKGTVQHYERELFYDKEKGILVYVPLELTDPEVQTIGNLEYYYTDLTFNYVLCKTKTIKQNKELRWNKNLKVSYEHTDMFLRIKLYSDFKVAYFPDMTVIHEPIRTKDYNQFRTRPQCGKIFGDSWNLKMALGVCGTKIIYETQKKQKINVPKDIIIQNQIIEQTKEEIQDPVKTQIPKNLFIKLIEQNITFWFLKQSCYDIIINKKIPTENITIGVPNEEIKTLLEKYNIEIIVETSRKTKKTAIEDNEFLVPFPVKKYLEKYTGKSWRQLKNES